MDLRVSLCPGCGKMFQMNPRNLCGDCIRLEDSQFNTLERMLIRNRYMNNEEAAKVANVTVDKIRSWIRSGKLRLSEYPNLEDQCDLCKSPMRSTGNLCEACTRRIHAEIAHTNEQDRLMKERLRSTSPTTN